MHVKPEAKLDSKPENKLEIMDESVTYKIRIGNLPESASKYELEDLLTMVCDVQDLRLETSDDRGHIETVAYAQLNTEQDVKNCVDRFNGASFRGATLNVRDDKPFVPPPPKPASLKSKLAKAKRKAPARKAAPRKAN